MKSILSRVLRSPTRVERKGYDSEKHAALTLRELDLEESALGLLIIRLEKPKTAIRHLFGHRFADYDFEVLFLSSQESTAIRGHYTH
jgi:hypothetical protein